MKPVTGGPPPGSTRSCHRQANIQSTDGYPIELRRVLPPRHLAFPARPAGPHRARRTNVVRSINVPGCSDKSHSAAPVLLATRHPYGFNGGEGVISDRPSSVYGPWPIGPEDRPMVRQNLSRRRARSVHPAPQRAEGRLAGPFDSAINRGNAPRPIRAGGNHVRCVWPGMPYRLDAINERMTWSPPIDNSRVPRPAGACRQHTF